MAKMGDGYGSECHLLRWMGRHRSAFDRAIIAACKLQNTAVLSWLDCHFDSNKPWPDRELKGLEFINDSELQRQWETWWPQTGEAHNWDAVGQLDGSWLLLEAKANLAEISSKCKAKSERSIKQIEAFLKKAAEDIGVEYSEAWLKKHYQLANRLAVTSWLNQRKFPSRLLLVYFVGDLGNSSRKAPQTVDEWLAALTKQKEDLGLPGSLPFAVTVFLHVAKPEAWDVDGNKIKLI